MAISKPAYGGKKQHACMHISFSGTSRSAVLSRVVVHSPVVKRLSRAVVVLEGLSGTVHIFTQGLNLQWTNNLISVQHFNDDIFVRTHQPIFLDVQRFVQYNPLDYLLATRRGERPFVMVDSG